VYTVLTLKVEDVAYYIVYNKVTKKEMSRYESILDAYEDIKRRNV
jgi:hypothetical protein